MPNPSPPNPLSPGSNLLGVVLVLIGVVALSSMDGLVKHLVTDGLAVIQLLAVRSWIVVVLLSLWLPRAGGIQALKTERKGANLLRVALGFGAPFFFFLALETLPLADATVIFFGSTFMMTGLSVPLFKEQVGIHRWSAIVIGFVGVVVAMDPGGDIFRLGALYVFLASLSYSLFMLAGRWLGPSEGTYKLVFYFHGWVLVVSTSFALPGFQAMTVEMVLTLAAIATLGMLGNLAQVRGFVLAPVGLLAPFEYVAIPVAVMLGYVFWNEVPGLNFWLGAGLIVVSGVYLVHREVLARRQSRAAAASTAAAGQGPLAVPIPPSVAPRPNGD